MKNLIMMTALAALLPSCQAAAFESGPVETARAEPLIVGSLPQFPRLQENIDKVWEYVRVLGQAPEGLEPPTFHLSSFAREEQAPEFTRWQDAWLREHPEVPYPFPPRFRGYYYAGTGVIQADPAETFMNPRFYRQGSDGRMRDLVGYGYYSAGHEMLHYVMEARKIPMEEHHCRFVSPRREGEESYMSQLADFLIKEKLGSSALHLYGVREEVMLDPCGQLERSRRDRKQGDKG